MPKQSITYLSETIRIGLWSITETLEDFFLRYSYLTDYRDEVEKNFKADNRKREYLAVRALLYEMTSGNGRILYDGDGSPYLIDGQFCSISHTRGYAVLIISEMFPVGIDIEYYSSRVEKIADRFIRTDEKAETIMLKLIHWSAKEALFKLFHNDRLDYFDMKLRPFTEEKSGAIIAENLKFGTVQDIYYIIDDEYVLTYCIELSPTKLC
jgi:4'-phosphopantetheinyl transferase EntD